MGGKSSSQTVGYKQYAGAALILAQLIHKIKNVKIGDQQAWAGSLDSEGTISINAPKLFGASGAEGGFIGDIQFQPGLPTQMPNAYLLSKLGPDISASRGVSQVVLPQVYLGNNPYIKDFEFLGERIHLLSDGSTQWYDAKAEINGNNVTDTPILVDDIWDYQILPQQANPGTTNLVPPTSGYTSGQAPFGHGSSVGGGTQNTDWPLYGTIWLRRTISLPIGQYLKLTIVAENGCIVLIDGQVAASVNPGNTQPPPTYNGFVTIGPFDANKTVTLTIKGYDEANVGSTDTFLSIVGEFVSGAVDINPAHVLRECLTNKEFGYGYDDDDIDDASFMAAADQLYAEGFGMGYLWDDNSTQLASIIEKIEELIDGNMYVDRDTLKWTLTLVRNDYDPDTLVELTADNEVISISDYARPEFLDLVNQITVNYYNSGVGGNGSISVSNSALFLQQGVRVAVTKDYDMCGTSTLAAVLAQRELNVASSPLSSCKVICNSAAKDFKRGTVFKLTSPRHNYNQTIMRVTGIKRGDNTTKQITLTVVEDKFGLPSVAFTSTEPPAWVDPADQPTAIVNRVALEVPYAFLLGHDTQANVDASLAADPDIGYFGVSGARVAGASSAAIYADSGAGYIDVALLDFCPYGELSADIDYLTNTFTLVNTEDLDELTSGAVGIIDGEFISFGSNAGAVFSSVKRGVLDSVPTKHLAGAKVFFIQNYLDGPQTQFAEGESVSVKLATNAALGQLNLGVAPVDTVTFASRAIKPYPPGALKLNATAYKTTVTGALTVTWAHRNRVSQADTIVDTTQASVTPEVNTRYTLEFYDASNALLVSRSNIGPATAAVVLNYTGNVTLKLWAVSDNGASLQKHSHTFAYTPPGGTVASSITATDYTPTDTAVIINGGGD